MPIFFTLKGNTIKKLKLRLCTRGNFDYRSVDFYFEDLKNGSYLLHIPQLIEIPGNAGRSDLDTITNTLSSYCSAMHKNIASKISCEYVYELIDPPMSVQIQAGSGSYKHFRENFLKRLAEVFRNLEWIHDHPD